MSPVPVMNCANTSATIRSRMPRQRKPADISAALRALDIGSEPRTVLDPGRPGGRGLPGLYLAGEVLKRERAGAGLGAIFWTGRKYVPRRQAGAQECPLLHLLYTCHHGHEPVPRAFGRNTPSVPISDDVPGFFFRPALHRTLPSPSERSTRPMRIINQEHDHAGARRPQLVFSSRKFHIKPLPSIKRTRRLSRVRNRNPILLPAARHQRELQ